MSLVLTLNAGSSSLKFALFDAGDLSTLARGQFDGLGGEGARFDVALQGQPKHRDALAASSAAEALEALIGWLQAHFPGRRVDAVSHRVVHGGPDGIAPVRVDAETFAKLSRLIPLAPLHQPHNLKGIEAAQSAFGDAVQVACFDTAFHRTHSYISDTFALPHDWYDKGVRRYGFHGLSYEYIAHALAQNYPDLYAKRVIVAHLGNGASMCALREGRSVASTMGFTALDGLPMGTRCGQIDPGVLLYLMTEGGMDAEALTHLLYHDAGLKGLSGKTNDVRALLADDHPQSRAALGYFADQCRRAIGGLAASIGGLDALVFSGGIGENAAPVRQDILHDMTWLGIHLDSEANHAGRTEISLAHSPVKVLVLPTDEEQMLARHAIELLHLD